MGFLPFICRRCVLPMGTMMVAPLGVNDSPRPESASGRGGGMGSSPARTSEPRVIGSPIAKIETAIRDMENVRCILSPHGKSVGWVDLDPPETGAGPGGETRTLHDFGQLHAAGHRP